MKLNLYFVIFLATLFCACNGNDAFVPKPKGYPRIDFPAEGGKMVAVKECNYAFELPNYCTLKPDPYPNPDECWYNVYFLPFNATLHLSYKPIASRKELFKLLDDANTMVFKHVMKADEITENYINNPGKWGVLYELDGSTATHTQFYITDSANHFLRGSVYFNVKTENDSVAPIVAFLKKDVLKIIASLNWQK